MIRNQPACRSRKLVSIASLFAALVMVGIVATPAQADSHLGFDQDGSSLGWAEFHSYGDAFRVVDTKEDYWGVGVRYSYIRKNGTTQRGSHWVTTGAQTDKWFDHNFGEGRSVWYQVCVKDGPVVLACTKVIKDTA